MSGTSLDGLDIVYVNFYQDKNWKYEIINSKTYMYDKKWISSLENISKEKINYEMLSLKIKEKLEKKRF